MAPRTASDVVVLPPPPDVIDITPPISPVEAAEDNNDDITDDNDKFGTSTIIITEEDHHLGTITSKTKKEDVTTTSGGGGGGIPRNDRPWYRRGGMAVNTGLIALLNNFVPLFYMISYLDDETPFFAFVAEGKYEYTLRQLYYGAMIFVVLCSSLPLRGKLPQSVYCALCIPNFFLSLSLPLLWSISSSSSTSSVSSESSSSSSSFMSMNQLYLAASIVSLIKGNICMSVCLHRYAAHAAFTCGPKTQWFVSILGCLAFQGGPLWWGSQHRCHHKHCDMERDPHSAKMVGVEKAFAFFERNLDIEEEFVPRHLVGAGEPLRILDTWAFGVVSLELLCAWYLGGGTGGGSAAAPALLWVVYTSGWMCQAVTLWFNVIHHPPRQPGDDVVDVNATNKSTLKATCLSKNGTPSSISPRFFHHLPKGCREMAGLFLPFHFMNMICTIMLMIVQEGEHDVHHVQSRLAQRSYLDCAYWGFIWPMEKMGLVWNVVHYPSDGVFGKKSKDE